MFLLALCGSDIALFVVLLLVLALLVVDLEVAELVGVLNDSGHKFEKTLQRKSFRLRIRVLTLASQFLPTLHNFSLN
jgi:hypothetical protein